MSFGKHLVRLGAGLLAGVMVETGPASSVIPMPDPLTRVPLVGLLPRWTWDPLHATPPSTTDEGTVDDDGATRAIAFVRSLLHDDFPDGMEVVAAYRLDGNGFYVVQVVTPTGSDASFTIELLDAGTSPSARVVRRPR